MVTTPPADGGDADDLPEQFRVRKGKRAEMLAAGVEPYVATFERTHAIAQLRALFPDLSAGEETGERVAVAGRVIFLRNTGKLCFARLRDGDGTEVQAMLSLDRVGDESLAEFKRLVDIGDHLGVRGEVVQSKRGELSVMAEEWLITSKALRPLPVEHRELSDETRVRQRYVDLITRPQARAAARRRVDTTRALRESLHRRGFDEIETPILQTLHGGAAARPFSTHMNAYDIPLYLRIATELFLKRAVVGGMHHVFEIGRVFRNEGVDSTHSPEYSMLEAYSVYSDYHDIARLTRELIQEAALAVMGTLVIERDDGSEQNLSGEWDMVDLYSLVSEAVGDVITPATDQPTLYQLAGKNGIELSADVGPGKAVEELLEELVVPTFTRPTFVLDYPVDTSPLVRQHRSKQDVVEKWDLYIDQTELATGYTELTDAVVQRERLTEQARLAAAGDPEAMALDEDFLRAMEYGLPPLGGMGMGIDRLLMVLTGLGIRETMLFPLVKPE